MEIQQFQQSINNGLGRVILHLQKNSWKPYAQTIEHVCLHNTAYDAQCEGSRAGYVHEIVRLTDDPQYFSNLVAGALLDAQEYWDAHHLFGLARLFAKTGDVRAREAMYEKFRRNNAEQKFLGDIQIVNLDGASGLLFVVERIGEYLQAHPDDWVDDDLLREAQEESGINAEQIVRDAAATNPKIQRYLESVAESRKPRPRRDPDYRQFSYAEWHNRILTENGNVPRGWLFGWGRHAPDEALRQAAADLLTEQEESRLLAFLRIFYFRVFPLDHQRIIDLARDDNQDISVASLNALRNIQHDSVRALALEIIDQGKPGGNVIPLLVMNFIEGDQDRINSMLEKQPNEDDFHWTAHAAVRVFEANPSSDALGSMLRIYERVRCSLCRNGAVGILINQQIIPAWMLQECLHDSYDGTRMAAHKYSK